MRASFRLDAERHSGRVSPGGLLAALRPRTVAAPTTTQGKHWPLYEHVQSLAPLCVEWALAGGTS